MKKLIFLFIVLISNFSHAITTSPNIKDLETKLRYASVSSISEEMIVAADELLKYIPNHAIAHFERAEGLAQLGRYEEAIISYDLALKYKKPYNLNYHLSGFLHYKKGCCLEQLNKLEEALKSYNLSIKFYEENGFEDRDAYFAKDGILLKLGRLGKGTDY